MRKIFTQARKKGISTTDLGKLADNCGDQGQKALIVMQFLPHFRHDLRLEENYCPA
jgi:hypothetical protein